MIAGHFGLAAGVKSAERHVPLWGLMLATVWLDIVFIPLLVAGVETTETVSGGGYGKAIIHADYTHSFIGAVVLSLIFGAFFASRWGRRSGLVLGAVALSHWVLDLVVHRGDLPILPGDIGSLPKLGFGLWRTPAVSAAVELAIVVIGSFLYWQAAQQTARKGGEAAVRRARTLGGFCLLAGIATLAVDLFVG